MTLDELVTALHLDLSQSYPSLTREWLKAEAEKQIGGGNPSGAPGMYLNTYLRKSGLLKED